MRILGLAAPFGHDASGALLVDDKIVAAAGEENLWFATLKMPWWRLKTVVWNISL